MFGEWTLQQNRCMKVNWDCLAEGAPFAGGFEWIGMIIGRISEMVMYVHKLSKLFE